MSHWLRSVQMWCLQLQRRAWRALAGVVLWMLRAIQAAVCWSTQPESAQKPAASSAKRVRKERDLGVPDTARRQGRWALS